MRLAAVFLLCLVCTAAAGQGTFKCKDAAGKITYSGRECHLIGQVDAGEVSGRTSIAPAIKVPPPAPTAAQTPAAASQDVAKDKEAAEPEKRCFTVSRVVKTAKGNTTVTSTRCNDKPEDEEAGK